MYVRYPLLLWQDEGMLFVRGINMSQGGVFLMETVLSDVCRG
jgi:hypothetical protein